MLRQIPLMLSLICAIQSAPVRQIAAQQPVESGGEQSSDKSAARDQSINNIRQITLAILNYEFSTRRLPNRAIFDQDGKPLLSWRVKVLPYLGCAALYGDFHLNEPWDSEHNRGLLEQMPDVFKDPLIKTDTGKTVYQAVVGPGMAFEGDKQLTLRDITDGTSNTIAIVEVEASRSVPWTKPDDWVIDDSDPLVGLADVQPDGCFLAAFLDGHVQAIKRTVDPKDLTAACTRSADDAYDSRALPQP